MKHMQKLIVTSIAAAVIGGCGSSGGGDKSTSSSSSSVPASDCPDNICTLEGTITESMTLSADFTWVLNGFVQVGEGNVRLDTPADVQAVKDAGVTLTIEQGVNIRATSDGALLITRGSKLVAEGTAQAPITFSSGIDDDFDGEGEWGGVILQGFAPQYKQGGVEGENNICHATNTDGICNVEGEGSSDVAFYGGGDPADDSGSLRYVRIAEGGLVAGPNNEINGLTLQGVGHETELEYIQVHGNLDDGIEWFGGTANLKYAVLTGNDDDDIDFDEGYKGNIQHVIVRKNPTKTGPTGSNDPRGIEANSSNPKQTPETEARLSNITIIGSEVNKAQHIKDGQPSGGNEPGIRVRGELTTQIWNSAVSNFDSCIRVDSGDNTFANFLGSCDSQLLNDKTSGAGFTFNNVNEVPVGGLIFDDLFAITNGDAKLPAPVSIDALDNGSTFTFDQTDYIGAVNPDTNASDRDWYSEWIIPGSLSDAGVDQVPAEASFVDCNDVAGNRICEITDDIDADYTLTKGSAWVINKVIQVGAGNVNIGTVGQLQAIKDAGVTLTIQPGVHVQAGSTGALLVTRGSKLVAKGTRDLPITFSSGLDSDFDGEGEWGGVIIQGFAPQYKQGGVVGENNACYATNADGICNVEGEGGTSVAFYGGNDPADDSGELSYVRIAEGGLVAGPNNEINGLTLQGVGYNTELSYIQVHGNLDDGIEWFGGTANLRYAVLTGNDDDDIDFDEGYQGNIQHVIVRKNPTKSGPTGSNDPRGIEANSSNPKQTPETSAVLSNITIIGSEVNKAQHIKDGQPAGGNEPGIRLRGELTAKIWNSAVSDFTDCVRTDSGDNTFVNFLGDCDGVLHNDKDVGDVFSATNFEEADLAFDANWAITNAEAQLSGDAVPAAINAIDNGSGFTFDLTDYIGAVDPEATEAWWEGWIIEGSLDQVAQ